MNIRLFALALVILVPSLAAIGLEQPSSMPRISQETPVRIDPSQKFTAEYPGVANREALVFLKFNLSAEGSVSDIELDSGGFHEKRFVDASIRGLRRMRFLPATLDGVPVAATGLRIPFRYAIQVEPGVTREFRQEAEKVVALINGKDYAGAHFHAEWMLSEKVKLLYEYAVLQATLAETYARNGEVDRALAASREATSRTGMSFEDYVPGGPLPNVSARDFMLNKESVVSILKLRFVLAASKGFSLDALKAHAYAQALGSIPADDPTMPRFRAILQQVLTSDQIVASVQLDDSGSWEYETYHKSFTVANVKGQLERIRLSCVGNVRDLQYAEGVDWTIPETWEGCDLQFSGAPGTTFGIVEFRSGAMPEKTG